MGSATKEIKLEPIGNGKYKASVMVNRQRVDLGEFEGKEAVAAHKAIQEYSKRHQELAAQTHQDKTLAILKVEEID